MNLHSMMMIALSVAVVFEALAFFQHRNGRRLVRAIVFLGAMAGALAVWQPEVMTDSGIVSAAGTSGLSVFIAVAVMFIAICLGIGARYVFESDRSEFDWFGLLRPLVVSPILLLPLIGTFDPGELQPLQLISLTVLSFQNGFFWQKIMENVQLGGTPMVKSAYNSQ